MRRHLLIADSSKDMLDLYSAYFKHKHSVSTCKDALECIKMLESSRPDAIVLELELRWGGGDGVLAHLADLPDTRDLPVVLVSTRPIWHIRLDQIGLLERPVVACLQKPFRLSELASLLDIYLQETPPSSNVAFTV